MHLGGCIPPRGPMPRHRVMPLRVDTAQKDSGAPAPHRAHPAQELRSLCWLPRGPVRTRPASSRQTCWRHIPPLKGSSSPAPPPANQAPHTGATAGCTPASLHPPPAPLVRMHPGQDTEVLSVALSPGCSACSSTSCRRQSWARTGLCRHSVAQHGAELGCPAASHGSHPSHPTEQISHLLVPPRLWLAVPGACGKATATSKNRSTRSQGVFLCQNHPDPKPPHPLGRPQPGGSTGQTLLAAAAGFGHLLGAK